MKFNKKVVLFCIMTTIGRVVIIATFQNCIMDHFIQLRDLLEFIVCQILEHVIIKHVLKIHILSQHHSSIGFY